MLPRRSAFVRRASFEGSRAESADDRRQHRCRHAGARTTSPPNQRRLERELVLAWDSGARPVVVLTKRDLVDDPAGFGRVAARSRPRRHHRDRQRDHRRGCRHAGRLRRRQRHDRPARRQRSRQEHADQRAGRAAGASARRRARRRRPRPPHDGGHRARPPPRWRVADRHAWSSCGQPVEQWSRDRASLRRRLRSDGRLQVPRLQARGRAGMRGAGSDHRRSARPVAAGQHEAAGRRGVGAGGRAAGAAQGAGQARRAQGAAK